MENSSRFSSIRADRDAIQIIGNEGNLDIRIGERVDILKSLPCADGASFDSSRLEHDRLCLPDTRLKLLEIVETWSKDQDGKHIFWLSGMAGTGKSTIARTVASRSFQEGALGASFFFSRGGGDIGNASKFFTSLAYQLASWQSPSPVLARSIRETLARYPDIAKKSKRVQWERLIGDPLSVLDQDLSQTTSLLIVVDALDECDNYEDVLLILSIFGEMKSFKRLQLRMFLTSRLTMSTRDGFNLIADDRHRDFFLHEIEKSIVQDDIHNFFSYEFEQLRKRKRSLSGDFPGETAISTLVERAGELFIYAATVCLFIADRRLPSTQKRLDIVLQSHTSASALKNLDKMYEQILLHAGSEYPPDEAMEFQSLFQSVVGSIICLFTTMNALSLAELIQTSPDEIECLLVDLSSVMNLPREESSAISILHPSFRDYLLDEERCTENGFWVPHAEKHLALTRNCLQLMSTSLKQDICELKDSGVMATEVNSDKVRVNISVALQYACKHWIPHLERGIEGLAATPTTEIYNEIYFFLKEHILHWLEALSLVHLMYEAIPLLDTLSKIAQLSGHQDFLQISHDAYRFCMANLQTITLAPLQIYASAWVFSPSESIVRKLSEENSMLDVRVITKVPPDWDAKLQVLELEASKAVYVTASQDGKKIASISEEQQTVDSTQNSVLVNESSKICRELWIWDAKSGSLLQKLPHQQGSFRVVEFLPDGLKIITLSNKSIIEVWDLSSLSVVRSFDLRTIPNFNKWLESVSFSPDGSVFAVQTTVGTAEIRNTGEWNSLFALQFTGPETVPHLEYRLLKFSQDKRRILTSWSRLELWDAKSGAFLRNMQARYEAPENIAISPAGDIVAATTYWRRHVVLWNADTGDVIREFGYYDSDIRELAFSPDGTTFAAGLGKDEVSLWDVEDGWSTLKGHSGPVNRVAFSPDGKRLYSASTDTTITIWDRAQETGSFEGIYRKHHHEITTIGFSRDGILLCSGDLYGKVVIWHIEEMVELETIYCNEPPTSMFFSRTRVKLAAGTVDGCVEIWRLAKKEFIKKLRCSERAIEKVVWDEDEDYVWVLEEGGSKVYKWEIESRSKVAEEPAEHINTLIAKAMHKRVASTTEYLAKIRCLRIDGRNAIFLPKDREPSCLAAFGNLLAVGSHWGHITVINAGPSIRN